MTSAGVSGLSGFLAHPGANATRIVMAKQRIVVFRSQFIGSAVITGVTLAAGFVLMFAVKATKTLRVSEEGELQGLDLHEHGGFAYHEDYLARSYSPSSYGGGVPVSASKE